MYNFLLAAINFANKEILNKYFLNNKVSEYLVALGIFLALIIFLNIFKKILLVKLKKITKKTSTDFDDLFVDIIDYIGWPFYIFFALYFSLKFIIVPNIVDKIIYYILLIVGVFYVVKGIQAIVDYGFDKILKKKEAEDQEKFDPTIMILLKKTAKGILWGIAIIIILQNLGYNISTLVAGLGIGGLAIAFALQNILSDIFASFSIYFDKPFEKGDFIIVGSDMGVVKKIGIKSTRIQALQGEELVISNKELTSVRVHNYKKMEKRRIVFKFGVTYGTPIEKIKKIPEIVKETLNNIDLADLDRVHFKEFGDFSLNYEVVYYLGSSDYNIYMDVQQKINIGIKEQFEKEKIEFAYPTQTILVSKN